jgi:type IV secretion system protein VirB9
MKKYMFITALAAVLSTTALANEPLGAVVFSNTTLRLTEQEKQALDIAKAWRNGEHIAPIRQQDGSIAYVYGVHQPQIVCAVLQVCDISMQAGENITAVHVGDQARWQVAAATSGGQVKTQHLVIKPLDVGLETSLMVATDKRTYHMRLRSHRTEYMPRVSFIYTDDAMLVFNRTEQQQQQQRQANTLPETQEYLPDLDFGYQIEGKAAWKPVRVYNDGKKTVIQMPSTMQQTEAPTLLVLDSHDDEQIVNYRLQGDRYIVDQIFDRAVLIAGVGKRQTRITISRGGE